MPANLNWTESFTNASQIEKYQLWRSTNVLPTVRDFLRSFEKIFEVTVERDEFTVITNSADLYSFEDDTVNFNTDFYHYFVIAVPVQGPSARSAILPLATPPDDFTLNAVFDTDEFDLDWTASDSPTTSVVEYRVMLSIDGADFVEVASIDPADPLVYTITGVDRMAHSYDIVIVAVDEIGVTAESNTESFAQLVNVVILVAQTVTGGTNDQALRSSFDGGNSWNTIVTPSLGQAFRGGAWSAERGEILFLGQTGDIVRTTDGLTCTSLTNDIGNGLWNDIIRVDVLGLYIAIGKDGSAQQIATSPDGVTWTRRTAPVLSYERVNYDPVLGRLVAGSANNSTRPFAFSDDGGITWALGNAAGVAYGAYEVCFNTAGRLMMGDRSNVQTVHTDNYTAFTFTSGIGGGHTFMCFDPFHNLFITGSTTPGLYTSPATGAIAWTNRETALAFQGVEDMIWSPLNAKLIGIRPPSGAETLNRVITSTNGINFSAAGPFPLGTVGSLSRVLEATVEA